MFGIVTCACGKRFRVSTKHVGKRVKCPSCGNEIDIGADNALPAEKEVPDRPSAGTLGEALQSTGPIEVTVTTTGQRGGACTLAIASFVLGILAFMSCWIPGINIGSAVLAVLGLVLGLPALIIVPLKKLSGLGFAIAGNVLCVLSLVPVAISLGILASLWRADDLANEQPAVFVEEVILPVVTLPYATRAHIESLIGKWRLEEAWREIEQARGDGATEEDLAPLRAKYDRALVLSQVHNDLQEVGGQVEDALASKDWGTARKLLDRADRLLIGAPDLPSSLRAEQEWKDLRTRQRRGPIDDVIASSRGSLAQGDFETAVRQAEDAFARDPQYSNSRAWFKEVLHRVGAGLIVESATHGAPVAVDGHNYGTVNSVIWHLRQGPVDVVVNAAHSMPLVQSVVLTPGRICKVTASLQPAIACKWCRGSGQEKCRGCDGTGKSLCSVCGGSRKVKCQRCRGDWKYSCYYCGGDGQVRVRQKVGSAVMTVSQKCGRCGGKGYDRTCPKCRRGWATCPMCRGTRRHGTCQACQGSKHAPCRKCSGIGKVPAD